MRLIHASATCPRRSGCTGCKTHCRLHVLQDTHADTAGCTCYRMHVPTLQDVRAAEHTCPQGYTCWHCRMHLLQDTNAGRWFEEQQVTTSQRIVQSQLRELFVRMQSELCAAPGAAVQPNCTAGSEPSRHKQSTKTAASALCTALVEAAETNQLGWSSNAQSSGARCRVSAGVQCAQHNHNETTAQIGSRGQLTAAAGAIAHNEIQTCCTPAQT